MPGRAFIPGPLAQVDPRIYKSLRGRQLRGLLLAGSGAAAGLLLFGGRELVGYSGTFLLALPGFAYGYFQPEGKPVEYWVRVMLWYYFTPRGFYQVRPGPSVAELWYLVDLGIRTVRRASRMQRPGRTGEGITDG